MNRIQQLFQEKTENVLSVYFTAGFPHLDDTRTVLRSLADAGADVIEIGIPFSDPVADGPTIQQSNQQALDNGMTLQTLFAQLEGIRAEVDTPLILMGYVNPIIQYGVEAFCQKCADIGIDGMILPDLPLPVFQEEYAELFKQHGLLNIFLITPQTSEKRIRQIDEASEGFIYMVATAGTTGARQGISDEQEAYFARIRAMQLKNPTLIGFGISNHDTFARACQHASGAIIGSAFINLLHKSENLSDDIRTFVHDVKGEAVELSKED
ncbi:tryptophan synthase, alpha chain [Catalinimonas alkaloidigena]|uniref:Tryptophan synthase alpha chain n=1 Tax=Catalinimonas alkaloidigena TaxID=1075417 RepID=A0A1G9IX65_9BACT|nr:tryptophan synthase subunit alpha [Catalinimonas alkaloidigena]SDL29691.1 tryptophan synthase, alpha chain [Catalinimonas alkaloidigena]